jgi:methylated-DNA-[protein]-cysteine S-methyltransferase
VTTAGIIDSPVGPLLITMSDCGLQEVRFLGSTQPSLDKPATGAVADELRAYFSGERRDFSIPVNLSGVSDFTRRVHQATSAIPYGETVSYGEVAARIGMPGATQAVGNALGANPVPVVIPCHRVIRSDGSMGWFTGGPHIKRALLRLEGVSFPEQVALPF